MPENEHSLQVVSRTLCIPDLPLISASRSVCREERGVASWREWQLQIILERRSRRRWNYFVPVSHSKVSGRKITPEQNTFEA